MEQGKQRIHFSQKQAVDLDTNKSVKQGLTISENVRFNTVSGDDKYVAEKLKATLLLQDIGVGSLTVLGADVYEDKIYFIGRLSPNLCYIGEYNVTTDTLTEITDPNNRSAITISPSVQHIDVDVINGEFISFTIPNDKPYLIDIDLAKTDTVNYWANALLTNELYFPTQLSLTSIHPKNHCSIVGYSQETTSNNNSRGDSYSFSYYFVFSDGKTSLPAPFSEVISSIDNTEVFHISEFDIEQTVDVPYGSKTLVLLVKRSNGVIHEIKKIDANGLSTYDINESFRDNGSYPVSAIDSLTGNYAPLSAYTQTYINNRLWYGNIETELEDDSANVEGVINYIDTPSGLYDFEYDGIFNTSAINKLDISIGNEFFDLALGSICRLNLEFTVGGVDEKYFIVLIKKSD